MKIKKDKIAWFYIFKISAKLYLTVYDPKSGVFVQCSEWCPGRLKFDILSSSVVERSHRWQQLSICSGECTAVAARRISFNCTTLKYLSQSFRKTEKKRKNNEKSVRPSDHPRRWSVKSERKRRKLLQIFEIFILFLQSLSLGRLRCCSYCILHLVKMCVWFTFYNEVCMY